MTKQVKSILSLARAYVATPEKWCKNSFFEDGACCMDGAIIKAVTGEERAILNGDQYSAYISASSTLETVVGGSLWEFNDSRGHADVLAAFDAAIALSDHQSNVSEVSND